MNAGFIILIVIGCIVAYSVIAAFYSVLIEKYAVGIEELERGFVCFLWPITMVFILPFAIIDFIRSRYGLGTTLFKFKKKKD